MLEVEDLYTTPVPAKIMNTLRHTKSEENLGGDSASLSAFSICGNMCDDNDPDWSQEDDEISQQVHFYNKFNNNTKITLQMIPCWYKNVKYFDNLVKISIAVKQFIF